MAYKPALDEGELHSLNFRSIRSWIEKNKGRIKALPGKTILYSGRDYDLEIKELDKGDRDTFMGTPMYKRVKEFQQKIRDRHVPCKFQMLPDVLEAMKDYPKIVDKDRREVNFANAWEFFDDLEKKNDLEDLLPNKKKIASDCWKTLSALFASNAVGDIKIMDGAADDYGQLKLDKNFILKELPELLKNPNLSAKTKKILESKFSKYGNYFDRRYTDLMSHLKDDRAKLTQQ